MDFSTLFKMVDNDLGVEAFLATLPDDPDQPASE